MLDRFLQQLRLIRKYGLSYLIVMLILSTFDMVIPIVTVYGLKVILDAIEEKRGIRNKNFITCFQKVFYSILVAFHRYGICTFCATLLMETTAEFFSRLSKLRHKKVIFCYYHICNRILRVYVCRKIIGYCTKYCFL